MSTDASQPSAHGGGHIAGGVGPTESAFDDSMALLTYSSNPVRWKS